MRCTQVIPIKRPMDFRFFGNGKIKITEKHVVGEGTSFLSQVKPGDCVVINGNELKILQVLSDAELKLDTAFDTIEGVSYKVYPRVENSYFFEQSLKRLQEGGIVALYPEGETHETPGLIPMKAGIASLVIKALQMNIPIKLQCFSYVMSDPEKYRAKVQLIIGERFEIGRDLLDLPKEEAYKIILDTLIQVVDYIEI